MAVISLSCPNCGGPVHKEDKNCKYCNASINFSPDYKQVKLIGFPCPKCGNPTEKGDRFCSKCASSLVVKCPSCRHDVAIDSIFCPNCRTNFAVAKLIDEANNKKAAIKEPFAEKERILIGKMEEHYKAVRERINREAYSLTTQANKLGNKQIAKILGYLGIFVGAVILTGLISSIDRSFAGMSFFIFVGLVVVGYVLAKKYYPPIVEERTRKELLARASEMREDDYWKKYVTKAEALSLKQKDEETEKMRIALRKEEEEEIQKIEEWLQSAVSSIR
mgnify:CR=1 FL=1